MRKFYLFTLAVTVAITVLCGCSDKKSSSSSNEAESSISEIMIPLQMPDINVSVPETYEKTSTESNSTVYIKDNASIIVNEDSYTDQYKNIDEYVNFAVETYEKYSDEYEEINRETMTVGDINIELLEYTYSLNTDNGKFSKSCMTAFFTDDEKIYLVTCKDDNESYSSNRDEFLDIVKSISFK